MKSEETKAIELYNIFLEQNDLVDTCSAPHTIARQCAIICNQREIDVVKSIIGNEKRLWTVAQFNLINELKQVKQGLLKL